MVGSVLCAIAWYGIHRTWGLSFQTRIRVLLFGAIPNMSQGAYIRVFAINIAEFKGP